MTGGLPDRRINAYRADLAASYLKGQVEVPRYSDGEKHQVVVSHAAVRKEPRHDAPLETELLMGEAITVYDENEGWAWVQAEGDSYVGYVSSEALSATLSSPTHRVSALRTYLYPAPDIKAPVLELVSMNSELAIADIDGRFARLNDGRFVVSSHLSLLDEREEDFVAVAERFLGSPYLWGGRTSLGLDCSSLVQLSLNACGVECPRDTDLQEDTLGSALEYPHDQSTYRKGDLVYWKGHVGIMLDDMTLLHANAHHMAVATEPVAEAIKRIAEAEAPVTSVRRPG